MGGKLAGFVVMALAALFAWRWLRGQSAPRSRDGLPARRDEAAGGGGRQGGHRGEDNDVITLEQDPRTGVFRPRGSRKSGNDKG